MDSYFKEKEASFLNSSCPHIKTTPLLWDFLRFVFVFHFLPFFQRYPFIFIYLFIFVGSVQLDDSLFVGIEIVLSSGLSLISTFTVTIFDANQCPGGPINHDFVLYFAHLGFVEIVLFLDISYRYNFLVIHVWFYFAFDFLLGYFFGYTSYFTICMIYWVGKHSLDC